MPPQLVAMPYAIFSFHITLISSQLNEYIIVNFITYELIFVSILMFNAYGYVFLTSISISDFYPYPFSPYPHLYPYPFLKDMVTYFFYPYPYESVSVLVRIRFLRIW